MKAWLIHLLGGYTKDDLRDAVHQTIDELIDRLLLIIPGCTKQS